MAGEDFNRLLAHKDRSPKRMTRPSAALTSRRRLQTPSFQLAQRPSTVKTAPNPPVDIASDQSSLKVKIKRLPEGWGTGEIYEIFSTLGNVSRIEIFDKHRRDSDDACLIFRPPPRTLEWIQQGLTISRKGVGRRLEFRVEAPRPPQKSSAQPWTSGDSLSGSRDASPHGGRQLPERTTVALSSLQVGTMLSPAEMTTLFTNRTRPLSLDVDTKFKRLDVRFVQLSGSYRLGLDLSQIAGMHKLSLQKGGIALVIEMAMPPTLFRRTYNIPGSHEGCDSVWDESQTWYRQTGIGKDVLEPWTVTQLRREGMELDIGRWLTYCLTFDANVTTSVEYKTLGQVLTDHNIAVATNTNISFTGNSQPSDQWKWAEEDQLSALKALVSPLLDLPFEVRYQLEACLSTAVLHECNITSDFATKLCSIDPARACKVLEKVAEGKQRYFNPMDIFRLQSQVSVIPKKVPVYCAMIRAAVVTPTTVYYAAPILETSNRIIRDYWRFEDRFLRVKFTDERYKGKIMSNNDRVMDEVFTRVKRTMQNGIHIGDRHYEFLAFGNSQFRENGAYFFAATGNITAAYIRENMGDFTKYRDIDRNVAKYASRLGQCFSTTRGMSIPVRIEKLDDIVRDGYCFSDGVGKMSPFLAQMVTQELGLPNAANDYPSVFQFRLAGCKGVLVVDPSLKGQVVQIRPSQEKWPATRYHGVEICRWSQFTSAYLNVQIILVLSALGVKDGIFVKKIREAVDDVAVALTSESKALELLSRNIDYNRMTLTLVDMIYDGFMAANDPFFTTCMKLWRSWCIKQLKEKARIPVPDGAFVFGCVDETGILSGHSDGEGYAPGDACRGATPEIFLQIAEVDTKGRTGRYRVIEGICSLARNPSLHPGDVRTVRAVNVPALLHLKNCVVLPQRGDRDLANMCSGGDLDGDDYLVMWDKKLLPSPQEQNHPPMDYAAPTPMRAPGPVTVDDITTFFVQHIKNDAVGRIATAHKVWADDRDSPTGIKDPKCLELAQLHSLAVDYPKTGVTAQLPSQLRIKQYPHWMERKGKSYKSRKILGKLYDEVQRVPFFPDWEKAFDERILNAYPLNEKLEDAKEIKQLYDEAVRRVMSQHSIHNEFEVWTTFVLQHSNDDNDYKFAEKLGETVTSLKQYYQELCYEKAGTSKQERDWSKLAPFVAAMYTVTADEVKTAVAATEQTVLRAGQHVPLKQLSFASMPLMSFPWLFPRELGNIAKGRKPGMDAPQYSVAMRPVHYKKRVQEMDGDELDPLPEVGTAECIICDGDPLDVHHMESGTAVSIGAAKPETEKPCHDNLVTNAATTLRESTAPPAAITTPKTQASDKDVRFDTPCLGSPVKVREETDSRANHSIHPQDSEGQEEVVVIDENQKLSSLDALSKLVGF